MSFFNDLTNEMCRICSEKENLINLLSPKNTEIYKILQSFVFIEVSPFLIMQRMFL